MILLCLVLSLGCVIGVWLPCLSDSRWNLITCANNKSWRQCLVWWKCQKQARFMDILFLHWWSKGENLSRGLRIRSTSVQEMLKLMHWRPIVHERHEICKNSWQQHCDWLVRVVVVTNFCWQENKQRLWKDSSYIYSSPLGGSGFCFFYFQVCLLDGEIMCLTNLYARDVLYFISE